MTWRLRAIVMAAIVLVGGIATIAFGERIGINAGMGWDGRAYVDWATDFHHGVLELGTTKYAAQRVFPSAIVHYALRAFGIALSRDHILLAFSGLNLTLLAIAAVLWAHLGSAMKWTERGIWVGFVALFGCFANARHALYYPALTDTEAFALGMAMTWAYLTRRPVALGVVAALGIGCWPVLPSIALVLLVLPRLDEALPQPPDRFNGWIRAASAAAAVAATLWFTLWAWHFYEHPVTELGIAKFATWVRSDLLPLTIVSLVAFLFVTSFVLVYQPRLWNVPAYRGTLRWRNHAVASAGAIAIWIARWLWITHVGTLGPGPQRSAFLCLLTLESLRGPLWGLVHHVVYFGPIVIVALVHGRGVARVVAEWGYGALVAAAMIVAFMCGSESRQWIHLLPMLVAATIAATAWSGWQTAIFVVLALAWSKLWFPIGYASFGDDDAAQRYYMHLGPWASDHSYLVHLIAAAATAVVVVLARRRA